MGQTLFKNYHQSVDKSSGIQWTFRVAAVGALKHKKIFLFLNAEDKDPLARKICKWIYSHYISSRHHRKTLLPGKKKHGE